jgi:hypothetical protein
MKIPVKRILLAAAAASSLVVVAVPQTARADEVWCRGVSTCVTPYLQVNARVLRLAMSARSRFNNAPVHGSFELIRDAGSGHGVRIRSGRFFGSTSGHTGGRWFGRYKLRVSAPGARVGARLGAP